MLEMACPSCSSLLRLPPESLGKKARCPKCSTIFPVTPPPEPIVAAVVVEPPPVPIAKPIATPVAPAPGPLIPGPDINSDFDFSTKAEMEPDPDVGMMPRRTTEGARWLHHAGNGYLALSILYLMRTLITCLMNDIRHPTILVAAVLGVVLWTGGCFAIGAYLKTKAWNARVSTTPTDLSIAAILAIILGVVLLLFGLLSCLAFAPMLGALARGGSPVATAALVGFVSATLVIVIGFLSAFAGVKALAEKS